MNADLIRLSDLVSECVRYYQITPQEAAYELHEVIEYLAAPVASSAFDAGASACIKDRVGPYGMVTAVSRRVPRALDTPFGCAEPAF